MQEALTNVLKHADHASTVTVTIDAGPAGVGFAVENDDVVEGGEISPGAGNGLTGMRERVALFGGSVQSGPSPTGWVVRGRLPTG